MSISAFSSVKLNDIKQFIKFCIVGTIAAIINFFVLYSFTEWLGAWYVISALCGGIISAVWNFFANKFWTFRNLVFGQEAIKQSMKFLAVLGVGIILNTIIIYILTDFFGSDYRISWVFATALVLFWNFGFNKFWTFKHKIVVNV